jgi:TonB family protein
MPSNGLKSKEEFGTAPGSTFEQTMAPAAFEQLLAADGAGIFVLSADAELVSTVRRAAGAKQSIEVLEDWSAIVAAVQEGSCSIVLLDLDRIGAGLEKHLAELERQALPPVIVAAASLSAAPEPMKALAERRIHRLLIKPASLGNTRLLLEAAINRRKQLRERTAAPGRQGRPQGDSSLRRRGLVLAAAMAVVLGAVVVAGLSMKSRAPSPVTGPAEAVIPADTGRVESRLPPVAPVPVVDPWAGQLALAQDAFDAGRLAEPPGDNALDGFMTILADQPGHALAQEGLALTVGALFTLAESALLGDAPELAATTLDHVRRAQPDSARLAFLDAQVARARLTAEPATQVAAVPPAETSLPGEALPPAETLPPSEIESLLSIARGRIRRGELLLPEGESALTYLERAAQIDPAAPAVIATRARLGAALVTAAQVALESGEPEQAAAFADKARELDERAAGLAEFDVQLGALRDALRQEREDALLTQGLERLRSGQLITPENDSAVYYLATLKAEHPARPELEQAWQTLTARLAANVQSAIAKSDWSGAQSWLAGLEQIEAEPGLVGALARDLTVARTQAGFLATATAASELELVEFHPPVYPEPALRHSIEGWVELEFIVDRDGQPRHIVVIDAQPAGRFDLSATDAVARYRYTPFALDGVVYERRVRLRVRFALQ